MLFGIGVLAIGAAVVGLFSLLTAVNSNVVATHNLINTVSTQAASDAKRAVDDANALQARIEAADLRTAEKLQQLRAQLGDARAQIEALKTEVRGSAK